jgi:hypothetical protein
MEITATTSPAKPAASGNRITGFIVHWGPTIVFNIGGPIFAYGYLTGHGWSQSHALMLSSLLPIFEIAVLYALRRRVDDFGVFTLVTMALTLASFAAFNSARAILIKDALVTGTLGLGILGTLALSRPFAFYMGRKFATDGGAEAREWWAGLWQYPNFRHTNRVITVVWGVGLLADCAVRMVLVFVLSTKAMVSFNSVSLYALIGAIVLWTITYSNRRRAEAAARYGDLAVAPGEVAAGATQAV